MTTQQLIIYLLFPLAGYLLGSIPFALVIGKAHGVDIRTTGSKNVGATNLGRTLGKKYFWQAFLLDAGKGFFPVLLVTLFVSHWNLHAWEHNHAPVTSHLSGLVGQPDPNPVISQWPTLPSWAPLLTAVACVLGHTFPIWLKFKGGKGVATSFGVVLGLWPLYTLAGIGGGLVFVAVLMIYRYISLASIVAVIAFATLVSILGSGHVDTPTVRFYTPWSDFEPLLIVAWLFAALITFRHRANIARLLKGTEPKVGQKKLKQ